MAIDTRFDLLTLLARRHESLQEWIMRTHVRSYAQFLEQLEKLGARPVDKAIYDAARPPKAPKPVKNTTEIVQAKAEENSAEKIDVPVAPRKRSRRSSEGYLPPSKD